MSTEHHEVPPGSATPEADREDLLADTESVGDGRLTAIVTVAAVGLAVFCIAMGWFF